MAYEPRERDFIAPNTHVGILGRASCLALQRRGQATRTALAGPIMGSHRRDAITFSVPIMLDVDDVIAPICLQDHRPSSLLISALPISPFVCALVDYRDSRTSV